jgi:hypothetical protein
MDLDKLNVQELNIEEKVCVEGGHTDPNQGQSAPIFSQEWLAQILILH